MDYLSEISLVYKVFDSGQTELIQSETWKHLNLCGFKEDRDEPGWSELSSWNCANMCGGTVQPIQRKVKKEPSVYIKPKAMVSPDKLNISSLFITFCYSIKEKNKVQEHISTCLLANQFMMQQVRSVKNTKITVLWLTMEWIVKMEIYKKILLWILM